MSNNVLRLFAIIEAIDKIIEYSGDFQNKIKPLKFWMKKYIELFAKD